MIQIGKISSNLLEILWAERVSNFSRFGFYLTKIDIRGYLTHN
jgi:hypothetical protein